MTVSVCMMVRNEEALLARALTSCLGLADEIVIVDTGSTDGTLRIAREFGAVVIEGGDRRHKAESRNRGILAATGDWIVILDADEAIRDPAGVRAYLTQAMAQAVYIRETFMSGDIETLSFAQMRIWRRGTFLYRFRAHEVPLPVEGWGQVEYSAFVWEHRPPDSGREWKREHMLMLLLMDVEENPTESRPLYYLGREYVYLGAYQAASDILTRYLAMPQTLESERVEAYGLMATCTRSLGNHEEGYHWLRRAMVLQPDSRNWPCQLAEALHADGRHGEAIGYLKLALEIPRSSGGYINETWYSAYIYDLMARCLWYADRKVEGRGYAEVACELAPDNERLRANLQWFMDGQPVGVA
jgi:glycosyltransferase involved in cell wall biosynthesis